MNPNRADTTLLFYYTFINKNLSEVISGVFKQGGNMVELPLLRCCIPGTCYYLLTTERSNGIV